MQALYGLPHQPPWRSFCKLSSGSTSSDFSPQLCHWWWRNIISSCPVHGCTCTFSCFNRAYIRCFYAATIATPIFICSLSKQLLQACWYQTVALFYFFPVTLKSLGAWNFLLINISVFPWNFLGQRVRVRWDLRKQYFTYPFDICLDRSVLSRRHFMWWIILPGLNVLLRTDWL